MIFAHEVSIAIQHHSFMTTTEMLSIEPWLIAIFISVLAITSAYSCYFSTFWMLFAGTKSQTPSLATITYLWFKRISTFFTYGLAIRPMFFFKERSPKARVMASNPPNLPIRIFPPACLFTNPYFFYPSYFTLVVASMLRRQLLEGVVVEEKG